MVHTSVHPIIALGWLYTRIYCSVQAGHDFTMIDRSTIQQPYYWTVICQCGAIKDIISSYPLVSAEEGQQFLSPVDIRAAYACVHWPAITRSTLGTSHTECQR